MRCGARVMTLVGTVATSLAFTATASAATALWHMSETSGTVMDDAAGSANGTLHNVTLGVSGSSGTAYRFNGTSSYVSVPSRSSLNPGSAKLTVEISVRFTVVPGGDYDLIRKGLSTTAGGDYKIEILHSGQALCVFGGSTATVNLTAGPKLNDDKWHRISCVRTSSGAWLSVDGVRRKEVSTKVGSISNSSSLYIGAKPGADFHKGDLDEAKVVVG